MLHLLLVVASADTTKYVSNPCEKVHHWIHCHSGARTRGTGTTFRGTGTRGWGGGTPTRGIGTFQLNLTTDYPRY